MLGCGPAGVTAALEAASRGLHVAVLEPLRKPTGAPTGAYSKCIRARRRAVRRAVGAWERGRRVEEG